MENMIEQSQQFIDTQLIPYAVNLAVALAIFVIGKWLAGRISAGSNTLLSKRIDHTVASFASNLIYIVLIAFVAIAALDQLGVKTTSLVAIVGAAGLAVGLALKDSLGNFAAGVMLLIFRPFKVGDFVEVSGAAGTVKEIRIFATIIRTGDNKIITVPNAPIMGGNIINYSEMPTRRVDMTVGVGYSSDLSKVKSVLTEILTGDARVLDDPAPVVAVAELADSTINLVVRPWVNSGDYWPVLWETTETIKNRFDQEGIEIPFPQMDVHVTK